MVWKYVSGDKYSVQQLEKFHAFFVDDLQKARREVDKCKALQKYGLPGWRTEMLRRQMGEEEALKNVTIVKAALIEARNAGRFD